MVGVLAGRSFAKGLVACGLGLALGTVGSAPATAEYRLDFGTLYLSDGLPLPVLVLAIFALPEIVDLARGGGTISQTAELGRGWLAGVRDILRHWWLLLRTSSIGSLLGAIPGLGGSVTDWIVYGHAVQTEKNGQFGKGDVRGVIAVEASNNAREGGALVPTLSSASPLPARWRLPRRHDADWDRGRAAAGRREARPDLCDIWSLAIANVMGRCSASHIAADRAADDDPLRADRALHGDDRLLRRLQHQPRHRRPVLLLSVGVLGLFMRRFGWPRPPFVVGFVLAQPMRPISTRPCSSMAGASCRGPAC
jgi:hypothetical protein